ncbi:CDP-diacylglycerol--glycerol-3-phosphate 3-phosphatidyltransferase [Mycoplasma sp. NEAQ87857]|uniref:CDP-diacylglycerol--glycerol-3-phosphate 3-phosphatidyltransferase n=1 Tax=Mycoplasma sp. NEAQ87857 TaxID=2683967 RepID=UPI001318D5D9|nr:CDP-diacylglycerol--glycerol-3-phosphate 3-phosphatidyltransferase [Mycoplasma sp. NEAQ87857]QGZ97532.1 CDP-diacylglycerol--glycerol-3-phosphate 3-phosphatidyltransferase [Mycoplasma sp. NEAQ87857]
MNIKNFWNNLNTPNKLTILRLLLFIPMFILMVAGYNIYTWNKAVFFIKNTELIVINVFILLIFIAAMVTDYFDGKIAREKNQVTDFGKLFDPIADKLITNSALIYLTTINLLPLWVLILFIARDLIVAGARTILVQHNYSIAANKYGKIKTLLLSFGIAITLFISIIVFSINSNATNLNALLFTSSNLSIILVNYLGNLPIIIAVAFSYISGYQYLKAALKFVK